MSYTIEDKDIVLAGWEEGIFDDPFKGIYDMRNVDIVTIPGEASIAMKTEAMQTQAPIVDVAFTTNFAVSTSIITYNGTVPLEVNTAILFTGADLPNGLSTTIPYYIKTVTSTTFTVATNAGGTTVTFSDNGTGTMTFSTIQMGIPVYSTMAAINEFFSGGSLKKLYFILDNVGRCWVRNSIQLGGTNKWVYMNNRPSENLSFTTMNGYGLIAWKNYLFVFTQTDLNVIFLDDLVVGSISLAKLTTSSSWFLYWKTINNSLYHQAIIDSQREAFYFANGSSLGVVSEVDGAVFGLSPTATVADGVTTNNSTTITTVTSFFTSYMVGCVITGVGIPTGARIASVTNSKSAELDVNHDATASGSGITFTVTQSYNFSNEAFAGGIPADDIATCLTELNAQILIGGTKNYIYPWDKISQGYGTVLFLSENFTTRMVTINTTAYIFAGYKGRIFMTNGSNVTPFWKIPEYLSNTCNPYIIWTDATFNRNQLYFGLRATTNSGTTINEYGGLWAVNVDTSTPTYPRLQNKLSYDTYSGYVSCLLQYKGDGTSYLPSADGYGLITGWFDGTKGGIDKGISTPYTAGESYIILDPLNVGQYKTKKTFNNIEYKLAAPLVTGESVSIAYRTDLSSAFTDVPITSGGQAGDISGLADSVNFQGSQWVQLKVTLNGTATNPSFVRLREVRLR